MHSGLLTKKIKQEVAQTSADVCDWIDQKLAEDGPWHTKSTEKETLNCLMRYHLSTSDQDTTEVCQYLNNDDEDDAWVSSITTHVVPAVMRMCR